MDALGSADEPMLEAYTTLGYVAAVTKRIRLGVLVTGVMYRYPGLLTKIVTTLDVLSGGRAQLGVGASWYEREQVGLGVLAVPVKERFERLEETLQICLQMWSDNNGPYQGTHYQLAETLCVPAPLTRPRPPILIGGGGVRKTHCCWWHATPMRATYRVQRRWPPSSMRFVPTARRKDATTMRSVRRSFIRARFSTGTPTNL
jgi:alkanesulfonate monooxygenase SsuD/methylene tetrahydromethanopterin reductase-like flavin-dependent oxidoreductase (luciferase family)